MREDSPSALAGVRVIEIANERTHYCGKVLSDLGADVVLVEPSGGSATRGTDDLGEAALGFAYANAGKRSVVIDLGSAQGRAAVHELLAEAQILLTGDVPHRLEARGLGYDDVRTTNSAIVAVSITPFGLTGPLADTDAPDLVCVALGGLLYLGGYTDGPPVAPPQEQAIFAGGSFAAVAALMALLHAEATGEGQLADVSLQQSVTMALENSMQFWELERHVRHRTGGAQKNAGIGLFAASDGYVYVLAGGIGGNRFWPNFVRWMAEESVPGADKLGGERWIDRDFLASEEAKAVFASIFGTYAAQHTRREIYERSQHYRVPSAPVNTTLDILGDEQLRYRDFFSPIELAPGVVAEAPGAPYQLSSTPWRGGERVPRPGEHTAELLAGAGESRPAVIA